MLGCSCWALSRVRHARLLRCAGQWANDKRHGQGICKFADGSKFSGQWDNDAWLQSMADPALSKLGGPGLTRATAGCDATFLIKACSEILALIDKYVGQCFPWQIANAEWLCCVLVSERDSPLVEVLLSLDAALKVRLFRESVPVHATGQG